MSSKPTLVMFNMAYYAKWKEGVVNRNYFIAQELQKKGIFKRIIYVDPIPYNLSSGIRSNKNITALRKQKLKEIRSLYIANRSFRIAENIEVITIPLALLLSLRKERYIEQVIRKALGGAKNVVGWSYNPLNTIFLDKSIFYTSVFDMVDDWRYHSAYQSLHERLTKNYKQIMKTADTVFVVSEYLKTLCAREFSDNKTVLVPNTSALSVTNTQAKPHTNSVVYIGTIESRVDIELVEYLVQVNPTKHFTFIGPIWKPYKKRFEGLYGYKNFTYKGEHVFSKTVGELLPSFDAGIIPHKQTKFAQSNDPLKVYDYLRAGLPVITTIPSSEERVQAFTYTASDKETFNKQLEKALSENSESLVEKRKAIMQTISWESRVETMLENISL